ncbi:hypothetical protein K7W42_12895 [Deinococcus sp. HMF7604]|uniref:hypothetical protein n=1 Tax=Deinococcus betulae TaxID=2873312 RepID=UPI001CCEF32E|nr:hypothetical protein [Deinococcus betulae]MBZ9751754.1 hypothetical protein [Deinococcus betulae]
MTTRIHLLTTVLRVLKEGLGQAALFVLIVLALVGLMALAWDGSAPLRPVMDRMIAAKGVGLQVLLLVCLLRSAAQLLMQFWFRSGAAWLRNTSFLATALWLAFATIPDLNVLLLGGAALILSLYLVEAAQLVWHHWRQAATPHTSKPT